jgi:uncharacterized membrane protein YbaN (DUF454 family)
VTPRSDNNVGLVPLPTSVSCYSCVIRRYTGRTANSDIRIMPDTTPATPTLSRSHRLAWQAAGWVFVGLGLIGAALPVMPTTCFMIAALACFTRGSPRLAGWLLNHPRFGPPLRDWQHHRAISPRTKRVAISAIGVAWLIVLVATSGWLVPLAVGVVLSLVVAFIWTRADGCQVAAEISSPTADETV